MARIAHLLRQFRLAFLASCLAAGAPVMAGAPADPLASPIWAHRLAEVLGPSADVRVDPRLKLLVPVVTEDQRSFPVLVDGRALAAVQRLIVLVDLNPLPVPLDLDLPDAEPFVALRIRLDQRTPVRALAQLADGTWVAHGVWVDAAGGGCSLPPVSRARADWAQGLGQAQARAFVDSDGGVRLRARLRHPMDTGFVADAPLYHLDRLDVRDAQGRPLARARIQASLAEDPVLTLKPRARPGDTLVVEAVDTGGIRYAAKAAVPAVALQTAGR
ncbi:MAG: quinoprotein dehydrogenase-associated SoxYZ-like carrier [Sphingomonadaceae bacterium]|uniref:quinoprotein dehydrogenase-associated SoxYZ-like carrier n=1 Tax=Thermaurantiacus sp. TaxID=2820283 RepID=UPI00298F18F5|nr:quinoprotein dehydrogenase-associated SoxYZ-like carrier [Thermaurantiacus sp.]MCS6986237.1 quinoprotein dehydrogenase-associated SoxYZ-like carrier [Sphingomonadaceae bacterium]MDW8415683.1 quinoprotein dehydrogenase-associated SoxYZ-like carrier [Thermaurantiacus sp.]